MGFSDFFTKLDYFGVHINFNFKSQKQYKSTCGGSIFFVYIIICITYIAYTLTSFLLKKHKTAIYYDKELFGTDEIYFYKHNSSFAVNFESDNYDGKYGDIYKIFKVEVNHVQYLKKNGESKKIKTKLQLHKCTYEDFYNKFNEELDRNEVTNKFNCIDNSNYTVRGIFADEIFEYFELTVSANLNLGNDFNNKTFLDILYEYDCKFTLFYIDSAVDVGNIKKPMSTFLNSKFIQLSPTEFKKVNYYFTIKNFKSDENWFFTIPTVENHLAYLSAEEYEIFEGENRFISMYDDFEKFARIFIRASTTRNIIERRYEKFTEFVASSVSFLSAILLFLTFIFHEINIYLAKKDIVDTLCIGQKKNLEKKIILKSKLDNLKNTIIFKNQKRLSFSKDEINNINEKEEISFTSNKLNKSEYPNNQKSKSTMAQLKGSMVKENYNICFDNSQSKINHENNLNILNVKKSDIKMNNYIINEMKNESEKYTSNVSSVLKNKNYNHDNNNHKNQSFSGIFNFNKILCKNEDNSRHKFKLNNGLKKNCSILDNNKLVNYSSIGKFDTKIKNKFTLLNNNIRASILSYKFCRLFSNCKKNNKNSEKFLENSLNYLTKSLDIFTYLKTIKNQEVLISILFDSHYYDLFKKLESLHFNSNNIFDNDNIYKINKGKRRKSCVNNVDDFWDTFVKLVNKTNKTHTEHRLIELIFREINAV